LPPEWIVVLDQLYVGHCSAGRFVKSQDPYLVLISGRLLKYPIAISWFVRVEEKKDREWRPALF
jgi:hypothetical protein